MPEQTAAHSRRWFEQVIHLALLACAFISILTTVGIVVVLVFEAAEFFRDVSVWEFLTGTRWSPLLEPQHFGILPLFCGTFLVTIGAAVVALPMGLATAIYLSEYASRPVREAVKPVLEVLAGIPSVVFGYLAIVMISPMIREWFGTNGVFSAASASVVVGFMILPMVVSLSEDVLRSVPRSLREAAYALGATKLDVTVKVVVPAAMSGIVASFLLALSRAIGETMAVALAAGATSSIDIQSAGRSANHDGLHRANQLGRHAGRDARVSHDLRRRPGVVCHHDEPQRAGTMVRVASAREIRMSRSRVSPFIAAAAPGFRRHLPSFAWRPR